MNRTYSVLLHLQAYKLDSVKTTTDLNVTKPKFSTVHVL